jgi:hypothetical protein
MDRDLFLGGSGHLTYHASGTNAGHLRLVPPTTYSLATQTSPHWLGYSTVNISVSIITGSEVVTLVNNALSDYKYYNNSSSAYAAIAAAYGGIGWTSANAEVGTVVYKVNQQSGRAFASPVASTFQVVASQFTPPYNSGWPSTGAVCRVGTGTSFPSGDPRSWGGNIFNGGIATVNLTNVSLSNYIWLACDISPWTGQASDLRGDGGRGISLSISVGSIRDPE